MKPSSLRIRIIVLAAVIMAVLVGYTLHLMGLQVVQGEYYANLVESGWTAKQVVKAARGEILDRNGQPLAANTMGRDIIINQAFLEPGSTNETILRLIALMEELGEGWIDNLPITEKAPFAFKEGRDADVARLKTALGIEQYATIDDVVYHLKKQYKLEEYDDLHFRQIAGVRYEMQRTNFAVNNPYTFASGIKTESVPKIKERGFMLPGVDVVESALRQYVSGTVAPHVIGSVGPIYKEEWDSLEKQGNNAVINGRTYAMNDVVGKEGAELAFEHYLKGIDGEMEITFNAHNQVEDYNENIAAVPGNTVVLTIDARLQKIAQDALEKKILSMQADLATYPPGKGHEADSGAVAVIDCKTGEVLVLATYPSYNLATYQKDYGDLVQNELHPLWNRALMGLYKPGSTFKPSIALTALAEGVITPYDTVTCGGIYTFFSGWHPACLSVHGPIDVVYALQVSCNIFFYDVGRRAGIDAIGEYTAKLGMGQPTGIEIAEQTGRVSSPETKAQLHDGAEWEPGDTVQTSIGEYDTLLTPLQMANYAATLANDGVRMRATILKSVRNYAFDEVLYEHEPEIVEIIEAPQEVWDTIRQGMINASSYTGTSGATFGNYPITVASKTGTPERADGLFNSTYICYAPAEDPQIAIAVVIENGWHGYTGAPVAKEIFDAYFFSGTSKAAAPAAYGELLP